MIEQARKDLNSFLETHGKSQRNIAKEIGLSNSVISQFLSGTYIGDNENVANKVNQFLEMSRCRLDNQETSTFFKNLGNTQSVLLACRYAHIEKDIALVSGDAGAGKTTALNFYKNSNANAILVTANACCSTPTSILKLICDQEGIQEKPNNKNALMNSLIKKLKGTNI